MSQDLVTDALNQIMNSKRTKKKELIVKRHSKLLISVLALAKLRGYIEDYEIMEDKKSLKIKINKLNKCQAIKPRFTVKVKQIEKYEKRYLPAKNFGIVIVSTSEGLMTSTTAKEKNKGGCLIAYFY